MSSGNISSWELHQIPYHKELDTDKDWVATFFDYRFARLAQGFCRAEDMHNRYTVIGVD